MSLPKQSISVVLITKKETKHYCDVTNMGFQGTAKGYTLGCATPLSDAGVVLECWAPPDLCSTRKLGK